MTGGVPTPNPGQRVTQRQQVTIQSQFAGPIPPPEVLAGYNQLVPDAAERILRMAEQQAAHRRTLEQTLVSSNVAAEKRAQIGGSGLYVFTVGLGGWLITHGYDTAGLVAVIAATATAFGVFLVGMRKRDSDLAKKREE